MNISKSFATFIQDTLSLATIGQNLYVGSVPKTAPDTCYWVTSSGGDKTITLKTGEAVKQYIVDIFLRSRDYETIYENMQGLEENINSDLCTQLTGYNTIDLEATTFPIDNDLDVEDRKVGLLRATITIYKEI